MPNINKEQCQYKLSYEDRQALIFWYKGVLNVEMDTLRLSKITETGGFKDAKTYKGILLRTMENEHEELMGAFKAKIDQIPCAYYELLDKLTKNEFVDEDLENRKDVSYVRDVFLKRDHRHMQDILNDMVNGTLAITDPIGKTNRYLAAALANERPDLGLEEISIETMQSAPEFRDSDKYAAKDRQLEWKRTVQELEQAETNRIRNRANLQSRAKGLRDIHIREYYAMKDVEIHPLKEHESIEERIAYYDPTKAQKQEYERQYGGYEKENKKLDAANDVYYKAKLAFDKMEAKRQIIGALTPREEKTYRALRESYAQATAKLATVKDQMVNDFRAKLLKEGKNPMSDHAMLRTEQIKSGDTTYMLLETTEATHQVYDIQPSAPTREEPAVNAPTQTPRRRSMESELAAFIPGAQVQPRAPQRVNDEPSLESLIREGEEFEIDLAWNRLVNGQNGALTHEQCMEQVNMMISGMDDSITNSRDIVNARKAQMQVQFDGYLQSLKAEGKTEEHDFLKERAELYKSENEKLERLEEEHLLVIREHSALGTKYQMMSMLAPGEKPVMTKDEYTTYCRHSKTIEAYVNQREAMKQEMCKNAAAAAKLYAPKYAEHFQMRQVLLEDSDSLAQAVVPLLNQNETKRVLDVEVRLPKAPERSKQKSEPVLE